MLLTNFNSYKHEKALQDKVYTSAFIVGTVKPGIDFQSKEGKQELRNEIFKLTDNLIKDVARAMYPDTASSRYHSMLDNLSRNIFKLIDNDKMVDHAQAGAKYFNGMNKLIEQGKEKEAPKTKFELITSRISNMKAKIGGFQKHREQIRELVTNPAAMNETWAIIAGIKDNSTQKEISKEASVQVANAYTKFSPAQKKEFNKNIDSYISM